MEKLSVRKDMVVLVGDRKNVTVITMAAVLVGVQPFPALQLLVWTFTS